MQQHLQDQPTQKANTLTDKLTHQVYDDGEEVKQELAHHCIQTQQLKQAQN